MPFIGSRCVTQPTQAIPSCLQVLVTRVATIHRMWTSLMLTLYVRPRLVCSTGGRGWWRRRRRRRSRRRRASGDDGRQDSRRESLSGDLSFLFPVPSVAGKVVQSVSHELLAPPHPPLGRPGPNCGDPAIPFPPSEGRTEASRAPLLPSHSGHSSDRWSSDPGDAPRA